MDVLGTGANLVGIGTFVVNVFARLRAAVAPVDSVDVEVRKALDDSLGDAVRATTLDAAAQGRTFDHLRVVLMSVGPTDLAELLGGRVTPELLQAIGAIGPNLQSLIEDFGRRFRQQLLDRAAEPGNPLFQMAVLTRLSALGDQVQSVYENMAPPSSVPVELPTATVPRPVGDLLLELGDSDRGLASRLASWIADPATREANLRHIVAERSSSFIGYDRLGWMVVAELAYSIGATDVARSALEELARIDERPNWRAFWQARAAYMADDPLEALGQLRSSELGVGAQALVECLLATARSSTEGAHPQRPTEQDLDTIIRLAGDAATLCDDAARLVLNLKAQALRIRGRIDEAVDLWGQIASDGRTGIELALAETLVIRANGEHAADRLGDARRALDIAVRGIAARRRWSGDSAEATLVACQAAATMNDWETVRRLGSADRGDATDREASHPSVVDLVGMADAFLRDGSAGPTGSSASTRAWLRAITAQRGPDYEEEVVSAFHEAAETADGALELERALRGLAVHGVHPLPRLADFAVDEPGRAAALDALARYRHNGEPAALAQLRRLAAEVRIATAFLVQIEFENGHPTIAANLALDAARRFDEPTLYVMAAHGLLATDSSAADEIAAAALDALPSNAPIRRDLRMIRVEIAYSSGDPEAIREAAMRALADGVDDRRLHWLIVRSNLALSHYEEAWTYIERHGLEPETDQEAVAFLTAHALAAPATSTAALDVLDRFQDRHDVMAHGLLLRFQTHRDSELDPEEPTRAQSDALSADDADIGRRYGAHMERFTRTFPDSSVIWSVTFDAEDPASVIEALEAQMPRLPDDAAAALETLYRHADAGDAPVGAVAAVAQRDHLALLVSGANRSVPTIADDRRLAVELHAAQGLLNHGVIVDASTLAALSLTPDSWPLVKASLARLSIVSSQRQDIEFHAVQASPVAHTVRTADGIRFVEQSEDDTAGIRRRFEWMRMRAAELPQELPNLVPPVTQLGELESEGTWAHAMQAAHASGRPLLCDDVGLADLARAHGVSACGTLALLVVATNEGLIDEADYHRHLGRCFDRLVVDLPVSPSAVIELARVRGMPVDPLLSVISRPAYWRGPGAVEAYGVVVEALLSQDRELLWVLTAATVSGASRALPTHAASGFTIAVLTQLVFMARTPPAEFRTIVGAMRASWGLSGDPLSLLISSISATLADAGRDGGTISSFIVALGSELDDDDKAVVARAVLLGD
jgi:tetratricopeptide (TPR) repeat protein